MPKSTQTRVVEIMNRQDASLHTFSLLHLTFKQHGFFEKVCRDAPCLFIIPTTLVYVLFGPVIPTYFFKAASAAALDKHTTVEPLIMIMRESVTVVTE